MLSLKRITLALGGLIATVFGGGLFGIHTPTTAVATDLHRELQAKDSVSVPALGAPQESKPDPKPAHSKPDLTSTDFVARDDTKIEFESIPRLLPRMPNRLPDRRRSLLVGVVELRI